MMAGEPFERKAMLSDLGELDHVVGLFREYQHHPDDRPITSWGPWSRLVEMIRAYLSAAGVKDATEMTASDLIYAKRSQSRTDVVAAMGCLSLLLSHTHPHYWDDEAVDDLAGRLRAFYAILLESDVRRLAPVAARGAPFAHGRPRGARGPLAEFLATLCARLGTFGPAAVLAELESMADADSDVGVDEYDKAGARVSFVFKAGSAAKWRSFKTIRNTLSRLENNPQPVIPENGKPG